MPNKKQKKVTLNATVYAHAETLAQDRGSKSTAAFVADLIEREWRKNHA